MWVFDGEEWSNDTGSEQKQKPDAMTVPYDVMLPELQVVEIVHTPQEPVFPFPLP